jgi:hypothetical protein
MLVDNGLVAMERITLAEDEDGAAVEWLEINEKAKSAVVTRAMEEDETFGGSLVGYVEDALLGDDEAAEDDDEAGEDDDE